MTILSSIPDPILEEPEDRPDTLTEHLNTIWDSVSEAEDRFVTETAQDVLRRVEWVSHRGDVS
jgi:hypothetical protein